MTDLEDYYQILDVDPKATANEIRAARNRKAMDFHPDRLSSVSEAVRHSAEEQLKTVNRAYEVLGDVQERKKYDAEWVQTHSPPKPMVRPTIVRVDDAAPGELHTSSFIIRNQSGTYTRLWFSDPDSWLKITGYASVNDADELPLRVDLQLTGLEWDKSYVETIIVRLDDVETTVRVELHTKTAPAPSTGTTSPTANFSAYPRASGATTTRSATVATPQERLSRIPVGLVFAVLLSLGVLMVVFTLISGAAQETSSSALERRPTAWTISLPNVIRAIPLDASGDHVMDEVVTVSMNEARSESMKLRVIDNTGNIVSTQELFHLRDQFPLYFRTMAVYPIDYDSDGLVNEIYFYADDSNSIRFLARFIILDSGGKILWESKCGQARSNFDPNYSGIYKTIYGSAPFCSENEAIQEHSQLMAQYVYPVYDLVNRYPRSAGDLASILRIKDQVVESYREQTNLVYE